MGDPMNTIRKPVATEELLRKLHGDLLKLNDRLGHLHERLDRDEVARKQKNQRREIANLAAQNERLKRALQEHGIPIPEPESEGHPK